MHRSFDGAINYAWSATILHLRDRVRGFGLPVVASTLQKDFEDRHLIELQDSELLGLALKLGLDVTPISGPFPMRAGGFGQAHQNCSQ